MILKLDEICDWIGSPQPTTEPRFLNKKMAEQYALRTRRNNRIPEKASIQLQNSMVLYSQASRAKNTLLIKIEFRQNATMQGRVIGKLTSKKVYKLPKRFGTDAYDKRNFHKDREHL